MNQLFNKLSFLSACSAVAVALLFSQQTTAAEWKITPNLNLNETYSDNITLAPQGSKKSDWVTQINPGIALSGTGSHLKVNVNYAMQNLVYAEGSSQDLTRHQLDANANAELIDNLFFLDGRASISQQNAFLLGQHAVDNINVTGNRTDVKTYSLSPYLRHGFSNFASSEVRYTHNEASSGTSGLSDSRTDNIQLQLNSGSAFRTLGWGLNYSNEKNDYTTIQNTDRESLSGNLNYAVSPKLNLTATGGYEKNNYISIGAKPEGSFWTAGLAWAPSTRTSIDASAGQRFFGNTYSFNASHKSRKTLWSLGYNEDITTTQSLFSDSVLTDTASSLNQLWAAQIPDPIARQLFVDSFIQNNGLPLFLSRPVNYLSNRTFLQKRLHGSVSIAGKKNTLILSLFSALRDAQTPQAQDTALLGTVNQAMNDKTKQVGGTALWNWQIGSRTSASFSAGYTRSNTAFLANTDNNRTYRISLTRQFQPKLSGLLELRRLDQSSSQSSNYQENAITASLSMKF